MDLKRGDIISLKDVTYDLGKNVQAKKRLYVVISNNKNNKKAPIINIASLSTRTQKSYYPMHVELNKNNYKCFRRDNIILVEQVLTVNKDKVKEKVTTLNEKDLNKLNKAIVIQMIDETGNAILV